MSNDGQRVDALRGLIYELHTIVAARGAPGWLRKMIRATDRDAQVRRDQCICGEYYARAKQLGVVPPSMPHVGPYLVSGTEHKFDHPGTLTVVGFLQGEDAEVADSLENQTGWLIELKKRCDKRIGELLAGCEQSVGYPPIPSFRDQLRMRQPPAAPLVDIAEEIAAKVAEKVNGVPVEPLSVEEVAAKCEMDPSNVRRRCKENEGPGKCWRDGKTWWIHPAALHLFHRRTAKAEKVAKPAPKLGDKSKWKCSGCGRITTAMDMPTYCQRCNAETFLHAD